MLLRPKIRSSMTVDRILSDTGMTQPAMRESNAFLRFLEENSVAQIVVALAAFLGALTSLYLVFRTIYRWYVDRFAWTRRTESILQSLRPNVVIAEFEDRLGRPRIVLPASGRTERQYIFSGRGYWVQAVIDDAGTVMMFAVTVSDRKLRPKWALWNGRDRSEEIRLNHTRLFDDTTSLVVSSYR